MYTLLLLSFLSSYGPGQHPTTLRVAQSFTSIQSAVNAAQPGDTVLVDHGVYDQVPIAITKHCDAQVYDVLGWVVEVIVNEERQAGVYQAEWDAKVAGGVYFYQLQAAGVNGQRFVETKKMVLVR